MVIRLCRASHGGHESYHMEYSSAKWTSQVIKISGRSIHVLLCLGIESSLQLQIISLTDDSEHRDVDPSYAEWPKGFSGRHPCSGQEDELLASPPHPDFTLLGPADRYNLQRTVDARKGHGSYQTSCLATFSQDEALPSNEGQTSRQSIQYEACGSFLLRPVDRNHQHVVISPGEESHLNNAMPWSRQDESSESHRLSAVQTGPGDDPLIETNSMLRTGVTYVDNRGRCFQMLDPVWQALSTMVPSIPSLGFCAAEAAGSATQQARDSHFTVKEFMDKNGHVRYSWIIKTHRYYHLFQPPLPRMGQLLPRGQRLWHLLSIHHRLLQNLWILTDPDPERGTDDAIGAVAVRRANHPMTRIVHFQFVRVQFSWPPQFYLQKGSSASRSA